MDISTKMTLSFNLDDATTLVKDAAVKLMWDKYGMSVKATDIDVKFNLRTDTSDFMDRGGYSSQVFSGIDVVIKQAKPMNRER